MNDEDKIIVVGRPIRIAPGDRSRWDDPETYRQYSEMVLAAIQALRDELPGGKSSGT